MKHHRSHLFTILILAIFTLACVHRSTYKGSYKRYVKRAEACCEGLTDAAAREQCKADIPRVEEAYNDTREVDYEAACFDDHFVCDSNTGKPTTASAQKIYDCMSSRK